MNLDKAFKELNVGMEFIVDKYGEGGLVNQEQEIINASFEAYKRGDKRKGVILLQDLDNLL